MSALTAIGALGGACLALSAAPQAWSSYRTGSSAGLAPAMLAMWLVGEASMLVYVVPKGDLILIGNYLLNLALLSVIIYYRIYPRGT